MRVDMCLNPRQFSPAEVREMIPVLRDLLRSHGVQAACLFGSAWQGSGTPLSDLDIAVLPPPDLPDWLGYYNDLHADLCQLFQADNIDLVLLNQAPLPLQAHVVLGGLRLLDRDGAADLEERVLARYTDLAGWRQENWDTTQQLVRQGAVKEVNMIDRERMGWRPGKREPWCAQGATLEDSPPGLSGHAEHPPDCNFMPDRCVQMI